MLRFYSLGLYFSSILTQQGSKLWLSVPTAICGAELDTIDRKQLQKELKGYRMRVSFTAGHMNRKAVMSDDLIKLAQEAMRLEYNVSKLYMIFRDAHPDDAAFWWQLVIEESNHAALIRSGLEYFMPAGLFPVEMLSSMEELQEANKELEFLLEKYMDDPPSRETAFNVALKMEMSAGEIHFQQTMTKSADSKVLAMFQRLNQDDKDHAKRIRAYMKENQITIQS